MITALLARWKLLSALVAGTLLAGYIAVLNLELAVERSNVRLLNADLSAALTSRDQCNARLRNIQEARESDATVDPDDLDGFDVPPDWLLPGAGE